MVKMNIVITLALKEQSQVGGMLSWGKFEACLFGDKC